MANETTSSTLDDLLSPLVAEALFVANERSIMRGLVRNYTMPLNSGKTIQVPIYPTVTAAGVNENTDLTNTEVSTSKADLTVAEVGIMTTLTDFARNVSESDVVRDLGKLFGEAIAKKIDTDITALFSGFSQGVSDNATVMEPKDIFEAVAKLRANAVPNSDLACVIHPSIAYDLKAALSTQGNAPFVANGQSDLANEAMRSGYVGTIAGVPVFETSNIAANAGQAGDHKGAVFHRDALGLAMMQDLKIETQRDASLRATEIVATAVYGVGELHDTYGVELSADSSIVS